MGTTKKTQLDFNEFGLFYLAKIYQNFRIFAIREKNANDKISSLLNTNKKYDSGGC